MTEWASRVAADPTSKAACWRRSPAKPAMLQHCLQCVPPAYIYGLKAIELSPRRGDVGAPMGFTAQAKSEFAFIHVLLASGASAASCGRATKAYCPVERALLHRRKTRRVLVEWHDPADLEMFYIHVLFHELGHHYVEQYRSSRGRPKTRKRNEIVADLHDLKISTHLRRRIAKKSANA